MYSVGQLLFKSNVLHITLYSHADVAYYSYILLSFVGNYIIIYYVLYIILLKVTSNILRYRYFSIIKVTSYIHLVAS